MVQVALWSGPRAKFQILPSSRRVPAVRFGGTGPSQPRAPPSSIRGTGSDLVRRRMPTSIPDVVQIWFEAGPTAGPGDRESPRRLGKTISGNTSRPPAQLESRRARTTVRLPQSQVVSLLRTRRQGEGVRLRPTSPAPSAPLDARRFRSPADTRPPSIPSERGVTVRSRVGRLQPSPPPLRSTCMAI